MLLEEGRGCLHELKRRGWNRWQSASPRWLAWWWRWCRLRPRLISRPGLWPEAVCLHHVPGRSLAHITGDGTARTSRCEPHT